MPARPVPNAADRHLLNRFSYGITPELAERARSVGGARQWFERQLSPASIADQRAGAVRGWYPYLDKTPQQVWAASVNGTREGWEVGADLQRWSMLRRTFSNRQVHEQLTEFWSNLLHVPAPNGKAWPYRSDYDKTVRQHALGRFDDMLAAGVLHPAMGCYLDNAQSTAADLNENLGREVLELHTVGLGAGYTEQEVVASARILTGWRVDERKTWQASYSEPDHWIGPVRVLGFSDPNASRDGRELARRYLRYLAHHPATATRVARRLCVRFVSDTPSSAIVAHVAQAFTQSGTDIKTTLRALVGHPEFAGSVGAKTRTPTEDSVATMRAVGVQPKQPHTINDFGNAFIWQCGNMGQHPFDWPRPDGFPDVADAWTGVSRIIGSWLAHWQLAGGYYPRGAVSYRGHAQWLPTLPVTFGELVDDLSRRMLARPASERLTQAATAYTGMQRGERIRTPSDISEFRLTKLVTVVLDTPAHMSR